MSFQQLRIASRKILHSNIYRVARQLNVSDEALNEIHISQQQQTVNATGNDIKLQVLEAWMREQPAKCTLENLEKCLKQLNLNKTAEDIQQEMKGSKFEKQLLEQDENCHSTVPINHVMANEVSNIVRGSYYKGLGFELGLSPQQMDEIEAQCKKENSSSKYVLRMLICWIEQDGSKAFLGKLYKALRMLQYNDMANKVYENCSQIAAITPVRRLSSTMFAIEHEPKV